MGKLIDDKLQTEIGDKIEVIFKEYELSPGEELAMVGYLQGASYSKLLKAVTETADEAAEDGAETKASETEETPAE